MKNFISWGLVGLSTYLSCYAYHIFSNQVSKDLAKIIVSKFGG